jgi:hypothetical protein
MWGKEDIMLLIKVSCPPFERYIFFHLESLLSTFSIIVFQTTLDLKGEPKGGPR